MVYVRATVTGFVGAFLFAVVWFVGAMLLPILWQMWSQRSKVKGVQQAELTWTGFAGATVDVYRNSVRVFTTPNDGAQTDPINAKGGGSYTYTACATGTTSCAAVSVRL